MQQIGYIYKISCQDELVDDCYIGSTFDLKDRVNKHKFNCNNENSRKYNYKVYKCIRENGNWDNWKIEILSIIKVYSKSELENIERKYYDRFIPTLNIQLPTRTSKQYKSQKVKCSCGLIISKNNLLRHRLRNCKQLIYLNLDEEIME